MCIMIDIIRYSESGSLSHVWFTNRFVRLSVSCVCYVLEEFTSVEYHYKERSVHALVCTCLLGGIDRAPVL